MAQNEFPEYKHQDECPEGLGGATRLNTTNNRKISPSLESETLILVSRSG